MAPTERATPSDFRWAAGFYEGEGCVVRAGLRGTEYRAESINIDQKNPWPLERLRALFGGSVHPDRTYFRWYLSGARARGFLMSIYGLLSPQRQGQVRKAMQVGEFSVGKI